MESERDRAKESIQERRTAEPELQEAISKGQELRDQLRLELDREQHRHTERMRATELGWFGRFVGGEHSASLTIAAMVVFVGILAAGGCYMWAAHVPSDKEFWEKIAERWIAVGMGALAYIFGRGPTSR